MSVAFTLLSMISDFFNISSLDIESLIASMSFLICFLFISTPFINIMCIKIYFALYNIIWWINF